MRDHGSTELASRRRKNGRDSHRGELRWEVFQGSPSSKTLGEWYFNLTGANGKIMLASEGYFHRENATRAVRRINRLFAQPLSIIVL